ncbi:Ti-type conjugative transfer relaxase TraA [Rhizobium sp. NFR07]|uniref:Ti-type conjugative transfer relaxase TraA n=1 Tax=Rhizobium sp. NFR07 TaxID=1566262 RepID=UPI0008E67205|nr:Ti-type conjugative transfer relaxase TraA [Rhizobium sp. NFR07]SFB62599.1 Ti-type conjugative transfer relaxase TraA [Rhizobium sp. NFR07]
MTVPHFSVSIVTRGSGRSAVLSAAYRHCAKMEFEREARIIDYSRKQGLLHEEFAIPVDAPRWLRELVGQRSVASASEAFWNGIENFEKREDAQLAKDVTIALPRELSAEQNIALMRAFVDRHVTARGMIADWVYHDAPGNPHVHLMMTLRPLAEDGFGTKRVAVVGADGKAIRNDAGKIVYELWAGGPDDFATFRDGWFAFQNMHLALAGLDIRVDGRSFEKQEIGLAPTIHLGVGTVAIEQKASKTAKGVSLERRERQEQRRAENARRIHRNPEIVLSLISREKSVFDDRDIARLLHRYIDDSKLFHSLMIRTLQSPQILRLDREHIDFSTGQRAPAKYTTRELIRLEATMVNRAVWLSGQLSHRVRDALLNAVVARHDRLSAEQKTAIEHVAGPQRMAAIIGRAGAGKTTMMKAAREVWELAGYEVVGGALAGKAAEGLEKEAGIVSRTLSSWELRWNQGRNQLNDKMVFVLDEAGMVSSRQIAHLVETVTKAGAKLILVGDPEQLQPIEAGAAFRAIAERIGYAELEKIYRQRELWMREASLDLARGRVAKAIEAYGAHGCMIGAELKADAVSNLIADWYRDYDRSKSSLILAHLRRDVRMLNELARQMLIERGIIDVGAAFMTADGPRMFAVGEQVVFLKNEGSLGVKNGMLARIVEAAPGRIVTELGDGANRRRVPVEQWFYTNIDHGYATTIHKSQGATVDQVKVLASLSLDCHLTYVAMTRHREDLGIYYGRQSFAKAGGLVELLSRRNTKQTTLDYADRQLYRQALHFAEARGLHLVNVARTIVRDHVDWTIRQKQTLQRLGMPLGAIGARLGVAALTGKILSPRMIAEETPMISGITTFPNSVEQSVEEKLSIDTALKKQWEEVSTRLHLVFAQPETAFRAINLDAMLANKAVAASTLFAVANEPKKFGALKGRTGLFASKAEKQEHGTALLTVSALCRNLDRFIDMRAEAEGKHRAAERAMRMAASIDIPSLSPAAKSALESVRDAIDRNDLRAQLENVLSDKTIKAELEGFAKAVSDRFGERAFLSTTAKNITGRTYQAITACMNPSQASQVQSAWGLMRAVQQLAAHERSIKAFTQSHLMHETITKDLSLK